MARVVVESRPPLSRTTAFRAGGMLALRDGKSAHLPFIIGGRGRAPGTIAITDYPRPRPEAAMNSPPNQRIRRRLGVSAQVHVHYRGGPGPEASPVVRALDISEDSVRLIVPQMLPVGRE